MKTAIHKVNNRRNMDMLNVDKVNLDNITILKINMSAFVITTLVICFIWILLLPKLKKMYLEIIFDQQKRQIEILKALLKNKDTIDHE